MQIGLKKYLLDLVDKEYKELIRARDRNTEYSQREISLGDNRFFWEKEVLKVEKKIELNLKMKGKLLRL